MPPDRSLTEPAKLRQNNEKNSSIHEALERKLWGLLTFQALFRPCAGFQSVRHRTRVGDSTRLRHFREHRLLGAGCLDLVGRHIRHVERVVVVFVFVRLVFDPGRWLRIGDR